MGLTAFEATLDALAGSFTSIPASPYDLKILSIPPEGPIGVETLSIEVEVGQVTQVELPPSPPLPELGAWERPLISAASLETSGEPTISTSQLILEGERFTYDYAGTGADLNDVLGDEIEDVSVRFYVQGLGEAIDLAPDPVESTSTRLVVDLTAPEAPTDRSWTLIGLGQTAALCACRWSLGGGDAQNKQRC